MENILNIEYIFDIVEEVCVECIDEKKENFKGLSQKEIKTLEQKFDEVFPKAYKIFLERFAGGNLKIFDHQLYNDKGINDAQDVSKELLAQDGFSLPENYFAFSQWQGYQFYYFINSGNNPDTFLYIESGSKDEKPDIRNVGSFTDWLIDLSVDNLLLQAKLHDYKVKKGIEKLELLKK